MAVVVAVMVMVVVAHMHSHLHAHLHAEAHSHSVGHSWVGCSHARHAVAHRSCVGGGEAGVVRSEEAHCALLFNVYSRRADPFKVGRSFLLVRQLLYFLPDHFVAELSDVSVGEISTIQ